VTGGVGGGGGTKQSGQGYRKKRYIGTNQPGRSQTGKNAARALPSPPEGDQTHGKAVCRCELPHENTLVTTCLHI
jgi:hypothetical protein